jgi:hypothetical protein
LRGVWECSHIGSYAPLPKAPRALADGLMLVFQQPCGGHLTLIDRVKATPTKELVADRKVQRTMAGFF